MNTCTDKSVLDGKEDNRTIIAEKAKKPKKSRAWELDFLRGISIIMVIWDHIMFDIAYMFGDAWQASGNTFLSNLFNFALRYHNSDLRFYGWCVFVFIFFFVSGTCTAFSKNNYLRGVKLAAVALFVTFATFILERFLNFEGALIIFGVLHCMALSILLYAVINTLTHLSPVKYRRFVKFGAFLSVAVVALILNARFNVSLKQVDSLITASSCSPIAGMFIYTEQWWRLSADYFPLLPFFAYFMFGASAAALLYPNKKSLLPALDRAWHKPISFFGRHSLIIYLALQVVAILFLALISLAVTGSLIII